MSKQYLSRNIYLLIIGQAIALTSTITVLTYSALVGKMLTGSITMATIPAAAGMIAAAITAYPASMFMNKFGRRRGFQLGAIFALLSGLLTYCGIYYANFIIFTIGVTAHGIFQAFTAYYRFTAMEVTPPHRHKQSVSYVLAGGLIAAVIAPTAAQYFEGIYHLPIPYAGIYILVIFLSFLSQFILLFLKFPHKEQPGKDHKTEAETKPTLVQILKRPIFLCASLNAAGAYLIMSYVMTSAPMQLVDYCGFQVADAASIIQWHVAAMFLPAFISGSLIARFGSVKIIFAGMICLGLSAMYAIQGLELINFYGSMVLLGFGWNFMFTAGTTLLERAYIPTEKARVQGINDFVVYGLTAASTLTSGYMLETIGWMNMNKMVFVVLALLLIVTIWFSLSERKSNLAKSS